MKSKRTRLMSFQRTSPKLIDPKVKKWLLRPDDSKTHLHSHSLSNELQTQFLSLSTTLHLNMPSSPARGASKWTRTNSSYWPGHLLLPCAPQLRDGHTTSPVIQARELGGQKVFHLLNPWSQVLWPLPPLFTSPCLLPVSISVRGFS